MATRRALNIMLLCTLSCGFLAGVIMLLDLDFSIGSGYASYSSFRADQSGTKVLFESLARVPALTVTRSFREASLWHERAVTLLVLGLSEWSVIHATDAELAEWERIADGNRLVLALEPSTFAASAKNSVLASRWGLTLATPAEKDPAWRRFFGRTKGWKERADDQGKPVILERRFGQGSIVIVADSRFFTNQALDRNHRSDLLSLVIGPYAHIEFDESHLGIQESGGVMVLARKYRLEGLFFGLGLLALLFFWKESVMFPAPPPRGDIAKPQGQGSLEGLAGLLRTHLAHSRLIDECLAQARRTFPRDTRLNAMQAEAAGESNPLRAYSRMQAITQKTHE